MVDDTIPYHSVCLISRAANQRTGSWYHGTATWTGVIYKLLHCTVMWALCRSALHWATSIFAKVGFRIVRHCVRGGTCKPRKESGSKTREWSEIPSRGTTVAEVGNRPDLTRARSRQVLLGIRVGCDTTLVIQNSGHISSRYRRWDVGCCLSTSMLRSVYCIWVLP